MNHAPATAPPVLLFGAFDRHNFGDLLFAHVVSALLPGRQLVFAGLAERDMRGCGGHRVASLRQLVAVWRERPLTLFHVGGELITCDNWQAAVMLLQPEEAPAIVAHFDAQPEERQRWAREQLGIDSLAPYSVSRALFPHAATIVYNAVGGVALDECDPALRAEVLANLAGANAVGVRDLATQTVLQAAGIAARLMPDPAVMVRELFGTHIRRRARQEEVARILSDFPQGYIAAQFSADFGDDETLVQIAVQLERAAACTGCGVVLFRAGAAPWHDDLACYRRAAAHMQEARVRIFASLDLWDICALIAHSRAYAGSSLHGRIVAMAFALPRINLRHPADGNRMTKQAAFAASWEAPGLAATAELSTLAQGIEAAIASDPQARQHAARVLAARYREAFRMLCVGLECA